MSFVGVRSCVWRPLCVRRRKRIRCCRVRRVSCRGYKSRTRGQTSGTPGLPDLKLASRQWSCSILSVEQLLQERVHDSENQNSPLGLVPGPRTGLDTAFCLEAVLTSCLILRGPEWNIVPRDVSPVETESHIAHLLILQTSPSNVNKNYDICEYCNY